MRSASLWCHGGQRYINHKVEAKIPALWNKRAPDRARGASGATRYLPYPLRMRGREGVAWAVWDFRHLPDICLRRPGSNKGIRGKDNRGMNITLHRTLRVCVLAGAPALALALVAAKDVSAARSPAHAGGATQVSG